MSLTWRTSISPPCTCPPRPSTDECPRVEECYEAWCSWCGEAADDGDHGECVS